MKLFKKIFFTFFALSFFISGCAVNCKNFSGDTPPVYDGGDYAKKIDNLVIIADTSSTMGACCNDQTCFSLCQNIITDMISALPSDIDINCAYLTYGHLSSVSSKPNLVNLELGKFSKEKFSAAASKIDDAGGTSRLDLSLEDAFKMISCQPGKTALFILGDGIEMGDKPFSIAEKMKKDISGNICIYPIHAGSSVDGQKGFSKLSTITGCGKFYKAEELVSNDSIIALLNETIYEKIKDSDGDGVADDLDRCKNTPENVEVDKDGCPLDSDKDGVYDYVDKCPGSPLEAKVDKDGCPIDSDGDGVYDFLDKCPNTKKGVNVDENGCIIASASDKVEITEKGSWIFKEIQFGTNQSSINDKSSKELDEIVKIMKENKELKLEIQGHTDSRGNEAYNYKLSQKRADSVKKYISEKGIDSERLLSKGYGPSQPIASNDTKDGRLLNRRVEFKPFN
jgi:OOP family OmpA-OmpF porin